jgi:hypothetical protein
LSLSPPVPVKPFEQTLAEAALKTLKL